MRKSEAHLEDHPQGTSGTPVVPVLVVSLSVAVTAICVGMLFVGDFVSGITWDEQVHVRFLSSYFENGWNVDPSGVIEGVPDPSKIWGIYVYGPVAGLIAHAVTVLVGQESWGEFSLTPGAYVGRHIATSLMAIGGMLAVLFIVKVILNSWRWALLSAALLAIIPLWIGHGIFNIKDIPVATGYTVASAGLVLALHRANGRAHKAIWPGWMWVVVGTVLAAGTRMASGVPIAMGVAVSSIALAVFLTRENPTPLVQRLSFSLRFLAQGFVAMVLSYLSLLVIYPKAFANPILLAYEAVYVSAKFPFEESVRTAGNWLAQPVTWLYLPEWFGSQLPLIVLFGTIGFVLWWTVSALGCFKPKCSQDVRRILLLTVPVLLQALILPLGAVAFQSNIYNGTRQFLLVLPATAVLSSICVARITGALIRTKKSRVWLGSAWVVVSLGMIAPTVSQVNLFPYNYTYFNFPTSLSGIDNRWPTDYWRQSGRELVRRLPIGGQDSCSYEQYRRDELVSCLTEAPFRTFLGERGMYASSTKLESSKFWYLRENQGDVNLPAGCELYESITRRLFFSEITIAQIATCDLSQASEGFVSPAE